MPITDATSGLLLDLDQIGTVYIEGVIAAAAERNGTLLDDDELLWINQGDQLITIIFDQPYDLTYVAIAFASPSGSTTTVGNVQTSTDATNGGDGTWLTCFNAGLDSSQGLNGSIGLPVAVSTNVTGITGIRATANVGGGLDDAKGLKFAVWGTPTNALGTQRISFRDPDNAYAEYTTMPNLEPLRGVEHEFQCRLQNESGTLTANSVLVSVDEYCVDSSHAITSVSLDGSSFAATQTITSLSPGATQDVWFRYEWDVTRPNVARLAFRADVDNWT